MSATDADSSAGRGRQANKPTQIPARGLKEVFGRLRDRFQRHQVTLVAGGLTFFFILSLFPAIAALVSIFGLLADPSTIQNQLSQLQGTIPSSAMEILQGQVQRLTSQSGSSLGVAFALSLFLSLWSAKKGVTALFASMNTAYEEEEDRGFIKKTTISLGFTLATILLVVLALVAAIAVPVVINVIPLAPSTQWIVRIVSFLVLGVIVVGWLIAVMKVGPDRRAARFSWLSPGAILIILGWVIISALFSWYASTLASYSATYGSFASVIVFLVWIWLLSIVLITGTEVNAQLECQTEKDTTVGEERPMGSREAVMADRVGEDRPSAD